MTGVQPNTPEIIMHSYTSSDESNELISKFITNYYLPDQLNRSCPASAGGAISNSSPNFGARKEVDFVPIGQREPTPQKISSTITSSESRHTTSLTEKRPGLATCLLLLLLLLLLRVPARPAAPAAKPGSGTSFVPTLRISA